MNRNYATSSPKSFERFGHTATMVLARAVRSGSDNSHGGQAAIAAMKRVVQRYHPVAFTSGYRLFRDGNAWCAVGPDYECLATDPAGFGDTHEEAVANLIANPQFQHWLNSFPRDGVQPDIKQFTVLEKKI